MMTVVPSDLKIWTWTAGVAPAVLPSWKLEASCGSDFLEGSGLGGRELKLAVRGS